MRNVLAAWFGAGALLYLWAHTAPPHEPLLPGDDPPKLHGAAAAATGPDTRRPDHTQAANALTALPAPHAASPDDPAHPTATVVATAVPSTVTVGVLGGYMYSCFQLQLQLDPLRARNVYTIFGHDKEAIRMPPALHTAHPFGVNIGGTNPAFWAVNLQAQYDSWLTVGITHGDAASAMSTVGIPFDLWTRDRELLAADGGVFWMSPDAAPGGTVVVAQLTVKAGVRWRATLSAQGRSVGLHREGSDWTQTGIVFDSGMISGR